MLLIQEDEQLERYFQVYRETGAALAEAKSQRVRFEEARKVVKARLMNEAETEHSIQAVQKQERYAYSHSKYREIIEHLQQAVQEETRLYWEMESLRAEFEAWRSLQASQRYERQAYGVPPSGSPGSSPESGEKRTRTRASAKLELL